MFVVGMTPGRVYSEAEFLQGKCAAPGTVFKTVRNNNVAALANIATPGGDTAEFVILKVGAAQNLVNGTIVSWNATYVTSLGTTAGSGAAPAIGPLGVVIASVTASTSALVCAQIYGLANALFDATTSTLASGIKIGATPGQLSPAIATTSAYITGISVMATVSAAGLGAVFLNYPAAGAA